MSGFVSGCVRLCPVMSSHVQSCPVVSGSVCYPSIGAPFSLIPSPSPISSLHIATDLPELLYTDPKCITFLGRSTSLPVRWWTLASTKCRTLGQKNGILKSRTDMFSDPMRRGWGSSGGPTGQGQVPGALNVEEGFAQVSSGSIRTYQQQHLSITTTHDHAGSLCMWLIALFQVEMMQWIPLGHVDHRMFMVACPNVSGMSKMCPGCPVSNWTFWTFAHMILSDPVRSCPETCPVMSGKCPVSCPETCPKSVRNVSGNVRKSVRNVRSRLKSSLLVQRRHRARTVARDPRARRDLHFSRLPWDYVST